jgi:hypothetical protein
MMNFLKDYVEYCRVKKAIKKHCNEHLKSFFLDNLYRDKSFYNKMEITKECHDEHTRYEMVEALRSVSTFKLKIEIPFDKMLHEAKSLNRDYVNHREDPNWGWKALCLHGTSPNQTNDYDFYGFENREEACYKWTEVAEQCPITTHWLKSIWPYDNYLRVRFVLLEPGGAILPHNDTDGERGFFAVNIALNQPIGCLMAMEGFGIVPWRAGDVRLMDIGIRHSVVNLSSEDRYHIIIHGHAKDSFKQYRKLVLDSL